MSQVEFSPLRSLDKFFDFSQFRLPSFQSPDKWANRVISNLLYFQSNYFIFFLIFFMLVGIYHPKDIMVSFILLGVIFGVFTHITNTQALLRRFKRTNPAIGVLVIIISCLILTNIFSSILIFSYGILMPLMLIMMHASCRTRSLSNKFTNKMESVGIKTSPMGILLHSVGLDDVNAV